MRKKIIFWQPGNNCKSSFTNQTFRYNSSQMSTFTDSSRGLKCKTFCKMGSCKNSAKNLQKFCRFFATTFRKIFATTFLQLFCNFFAIFLQIFCKFFANFLQKICKFFFKKRKELEVMNLSFNSLF